MIQRQCLNPECKQAFLVHSAVSRKKFCKDYCRWYYWSKYGNNQPETLTIEDIN